MTKSPGRISSRRLPTAEKAMIVCTPRLFRAAMFALEGIWEGEWWWFFPCREMKAICAPEGREVIDIGEEGKPHGY